MWAKQLECELKKQLDWELKLGLEGIIKKMDALLLLLLLRLQFLSTCKSTQKLSKTVRLGVRVREKKTACVCMCACLRAREWAGDAGEAETGRRQSSGNIYSRYG